MFPDDASHEAIASKTITSTFNTFYIGVLAIVVSIVALITSVMALENSKSALARAKETGHVVAPLRRVPAIPGGTGEFRQP